MNMPDVRVLIWACSQGKRDRSQEIAAYRVHGVQRLLAERHARDQAGVGDDEAA